MIYLCIAMGLQGIALLFLLGMLLRIKRQVLTLRVSAAVAQYAAQKVMGFVSNKDEIDPRIVLFVDQVHATVTQRPLIMQYLYILSCAKINPGHFEAPIKAPDESAVSVDQSVIDKAKADAVASCVATANANPPTITYGPPNV